MDDSTKQRLVDQTEILHKANDWARTEALWRPYVEQGDLEAQYRLAYYYLFYGFDEQPPIRAEMEMLMRSAADRGHPDAVYWLSHLGPGGEERDALLCKAGELGSLDAQRDLGAYYATGDWTGPCDPVRAAQWYRRAAVRGHSDAQYNLGFMYVLGEGVPSDHEEGLRWLKLAAAQGNCMSLSLLAGLYRNGYHGVPIDLSEAAHWEELYRAWEQEFVAGKAEGSDPPV
jgi:TPR repeat protein